MSRRRPTDSSPPSGNPPDGSPEIDSKMLPPPSTDSANGKQRTPWERAVKFFRNRPVTSLLIIMALLTAALLTFSLGRTIGRTISHMLHRTEPDPSLSALGIDHAPVAAHAHDDHLQQAESLQHKAVSHLALNTSDANDDATLPAPDERGAILDGVETNELPKILNDDSSKSARSSQKRICYRKFEPGKLGSKKTLCITDEFFFDISIGETSAGTFKIGVFGEIVPKSLANFRALVTCSGAFADDSLCFRGDSFHRVVTNFVAQGGSKATGRSIYGPTFREERSENHHSFLEHSEKGVVSWAEYPIGSQFFILIRNEAKYLDENHVVFGIITDGLEVVDRIHHAPRSGEEPSSHITITNCGDAHRRI